MYDRQWARSIVDNYQKLCARTQQIDSCIQQIGFETTRRRCTRMEIKNVLIDSLQGKTVARVWNDYKRLVRKSPLDKDLLYKVADTILCKIDVEKFQRQFDFVDNTC